MKSLASDCQAKFPFHIQEILPDVLYQLMSAPPSISMTAPVTNALSITKR